MVAATMNNEIARFRFILFCIPYYPSVVETLLAGPVLPERSGTRADQPVLPIDPAQTTAAFSP